MRRLFSLVTLAVSLTFLSACGPAAPADELAQAQRRWLRLGYPSYTLTVARECECQADRAGPVVVTVTDGAVVSRKYSNTGADVPRALVSLFPSVAELFTQIDADLRDGNTPFELRFDPALGFPVRYALGDPSVDHPLLIVSALQPR